MKAYMRFHVSTITGAGVHARLAQTRSSRKTMIRTVLAAGKSHDPCELAGSPDSRFDVGPSTDAQSPAEDSYIMLPLPPKMKGKDPRISYNATALAFLGDAVWEIYARRKHFYPPTRMAAYYQSVVKNVRAEAQAEVYERLLLGSFLTAKERDVLRWGRNATGASSPKRFGQAGVSKEQYRAATAVECLVGYLYLTDAPRLHDLMDELDMHPPSDYDSS